MLKYFRRILLVAAALHLGIVLKAQELVNRPDVGEPIRWEYLFIIIALLYILFRFFGVKSNNAPAVEDDDDDDEEEEDLPPPPPPPVAPPPAPPSKPLMVQASEAIGDLEEVGKNVHVGGKRMSDAGDAETYLMMAKVDKSYIRKEEKLIAQEKYDQYEEEIDGLQKKLYTMTIAVIVLAVLLFLVLLGEYLWNGLLFLITYITAWLNG